MRFSSRKDRWFTLIPIFVILFLLNCGGGGGGENGNNGDSDNNDPPATQAPATEAIQEIAGDDTQKTIDLYTVPFTVRAASSERITALSELIELGSEATDAILDEFRRPPTLYDDVRISVLAYALEQIGDERAAPVLADWLEEYMFVHSVGWPTDFVTHTIKVLTGQENLNTHSYTYLIDEKFDTILRVQREGQLSGNRVTMQPDIFRNALPSAPPNNNCSKTIRISGIDANGNHTFRDVKYNVVNKDFNQLSEDPSYSDDERAEFNKRIENWKETDENNYGGTTYIPAEDATYTNASNCGGSVTEIVANEMFLRLNIPMNLTKGSASPEFIAEVARTFGTKVDLDEIDELTVISFEQEGRSQHVEIPVDVGVDSATILSKDDKGKVRYHDVDINAWRVQRQFEPVVEHLTNDTLGFFGTSEVEIAFYRIDPTRITNIVVDSSRCPCDPDNSEIPVNISQPEGVETADRVVTVEGSVGTGFEDTPIVSGATMTVNGNPQNISILDGSFQQVVVLRSGDNTIKVSAEGLDGRRGCAVKYITSTTPQTTISVTLNWYLDNADVDLYITQPDGETAWYRSKQTIAGGRLDVDNTRGFGPENYFLSSEEGDTVDTGIYKVNVHYYSDRAADSDNPVRPVGWRVVIVLDEGTPHEKYEIVTGTLSAADASNSSPGSSGADWAFVKDIDYALPSSSP